MVSPDGNEKALKASAGDVAMLSPGRIRSSAGASSQNGWKTIRATMTTPPTISGR
jgi:hypothetical protein